MISPRVVATDLDGTLLRSDGTISNRTRRALTQAADAGAAIVFVTGRPPRWIPPLACGIPSSAVICSNGAAEYDSLRRTVLPTCPLQPHTVLEIVRRLRCAIEGLTFAIESPVGLGQEPEFVFPARDSVSDPNGTVGPLSTLLEQPVIQLLGRHPSLPGKELRERASAVIDDLAEIWTAGEDGLLEISARGVSKAAALSTWCARRGIAAGEVVAFGDMPNDIPMLLWAETSYSVANADATVHAAATARTAGNDDDGVAVVLERLFVPDAAKAALRGAHAVSV